ncbi:allophanate hydrolase [Alcaligenaceae bacterium C4P045]|nr:allophanate hydrolase [Alcaligenaceae bacterium C4P045]
MPVSVSPLPTLGWTIADWQRAYREDDADPHALLSPLIAASAGDNAWIAPLDETHLARQLDNLAARREACASLTALPLYGVPFAIKDNIDADGWPTTAGCPAFAYAPVADATAVARLIAAGAILVGKTNLDQFATGLVGTRSPHGAVANSFDPRYISGGSSSGSASVVARGLVPFSFGTDTAGSGRVPAGFNNIVGLKPTKGWLSTQGVVPACRTQDVVSIFSLTVDDASLVAAIAGGYDGADPYSRRAPASDCAPRAWPQQPVLAVPDTLEFFGDEVARAAFDQALEQLQAMGVTLRRIDFAPFRELAELLYQGPWVAERFAAVEALWRRDPDSINPVVRSIVEQAARYDATATFNAEYKRAALTRRIQDALAEVDGMVVPTSPSIYTIAELDADPIALNSRLGVYTNFANLADLSALALPAGMRTDGLPVGITLIGPAWGDHALAAFGKQWLAKQQLPLGATQRPFVQAQAPAGIVDDAALASSASGAASASAPAGIGAAMPAGAVIRVAVVGAHLRGMPLNHQLTSRDGVFVEATTTADTYRLYALANTTPPKPGLVRGRQGAAIAVELWDVPAARFGEFVAEIPAPLGIGTLMLADGRSVKGFICEPCALDDAREITSFGGWRAYIASLQTAVQ